MPPLRWPAVALALLSGAILPGAFGWSAAQAVEAAPAVIAPMEAKAALESDTRTLAYEAGRRWGVRVNAISAGPWASRAASAIGFIDTMIAYTSANAPLPRPIQAADVGHTAAFLCSPLAAAITGSVVYVDNGYHAMGMAVAPKA